MEVAPGIHRVEFPFGDRFVALYLLVGDEAALLIDTGLDDTPLQYLAPYLDNIGLAPEKVRYVVNSHADFDHTAGNASAKELFPRALFMCHWLDQALVENVERLIGDRYGEFEKDHGIADSDQAKNSIRAAARHIPMDVALSGGERVRLGSDWQVEIWHTPGHSRGHLSFYDPRGGHLIIADATLYNAVLRADGRPAFPPTYRYVDTYLASMQRFAGLPLNSLLTSHYPVYRGEGIAEFLAESRAYVDRVDQVLCAALKEGPHTLKELTQVLGPRLGEWPAEASVYLCFPLMGHLERLVQHGSVEVGRKEGLLSYRLKKR
jgi:glyoxylase-like metal-dependent hydrolase (beta-lactamase superfamily II)